MKRRRKKTGLSGDRADHSSAQVRQLGRALDSSAQAWRHIQKGYCGEGSDSLRHAHEAMGAYRAETDWAGKDQKEWKVARDSVKKTTELFEERCMINFAK